MRRVKIPKKQKKGIRGVNVPRGGFQVPRVPNGYGMRAAAYLRPYATNIARQAIKDAGKAGIDFANKLAKDMKIPTQTQLGGKTVGKVPGQGIDSVTGNPGSIPFVQEEFERNRTMGNKSYTMKKYYTTFEAGRPASRAVRRLAQQNGTTYVSNFDSQFDAKTEVTRRNLRLECGFNQKLLACNNDWLQKLSTYYGAFDLVSWKTPGTKLQSLYGLTTYMQRKFTFMNTNSYLPVIVKIRLWKPSGENDRYAVSFLNSANSATNWPAGQQEDNKFPTRFQLSLMDTTDLTYRLKVDPRISFKNSPRLDADWEEVKSFSKKLLPGEIWYWTQKTHTGPGLNLTALVAEHDDSSLHSADYEMTVEVKGVPCEGIVGAQTNDHIIGTGPAYVQMEWSKGYEAVNASVTEASYDQTTFGGMTPGIFAIRTFTKFVDTGANADRIRNYEPDKVMPGPTTIGGEIFVPVMSNTSVAYAGERGD